MTLSAGTPEAWCRLSTFWVITQAALPWATRLATGPAGAAGERPLPGLPPLGGIGDEVLEVDRRHAAPDAARRAEVGNAGLGRDAGAGEHHQAPRVGDEAGEIGARHGRHLGGPKGSGKGIRRKRGRPGAVGGM